MHPSDNSDVIPSIHLEHPIKLVTRVTRDIANITWSVNIADNHSTTPPFGTILERRNKYTQDVIQFLNIDVDIHCMIVSKTHF